MAKNKRQREDELLESAIIASLKESAEAMMQFNRAMAELLASNPGSWAHLNYPVYPGRRKVTETDNENGNK